MSSSAARQFRHRVHGEMRGPSVRPCRLLRVTAILTDAALRGAATLRLRPQH